MPESTVIICHHAAPNLEKYVDYRLRESGTKEGLHLVPSMTLGKIRTTNYKTIEIDLKRSSHTRVLLPHYEAISNLLGFGADLPLWMLCCGRTTYSWSVYCGVLHSTLDNGHILQITAHELLWQP